MVEKDINIKELLLELPKEEKEILLYLLTKAVISNEDVYYSFLKIIYQEPALLEENYKVLRLMVKDEELVRLYNYNFSLVLGNYVELARDLEGEEEYDKINDLIIEFNSIPRLKDEERKVAIKDFSKKKFSRSTYLARKIVSKICGDKFLLNTYGLVANADLIFYAEYVSLKDENMKEETIKHNKGMFKMYDRIKESLNPELQDKKNNVRRRK